jgi:hypothetical protein
MWEEKKQERKTWYAHERSEGGVICTREVTIGQMKGRCKTTRKRDFKLPWREAGPPNHLDGAMNSDQ